ncbi:MAG: DUF1460 domain-containing protein [Desulfuromusa sp.]|nr:DUF1460 domain-containing protein [Desulfuromusa sp.]
MVLRISFFTVLSVFLISCSAPRKKTVNLGDWNREKIEHLLSEAGQIPDPGQRVTFISAAFLETPYVANSLIGTAETAERFVLRLDGVDCFTLLDYVEALRRTSNLDEFKKTLRRIRYREGRVNFLNRNHFFSEWGDGDFTQLHNVTDLVGGTAIRRVEKQLNQKADGTLYLPGYPVKKRGIVFILPEAVNESLLTRLRSGDYVGIYSLDPGLDVSHSGIVVKKAGKVFLRHASSRLFLKKVVDEELLSYLAGKNGLIVYRPVNKN